MRLRDGKPERATTQSYDSGTQIAALKVNRQREAWYCDCEKHEKHIRQPTVILIEEHLKHRPQNHDRDKGEGNAHNGRADISYRNVTPTNASPAPQHQRLNRN